MKRILFLILGFGLGQGSMFLAQSYLIINHQYNLASASAIGLGFLSLAYWTVEMGGVFTFNKAFQKSPQEICNYFAARAILGLGFAIISAAIAYKIKIDNKLLYGIICVTPAIAVATTTSLLGYIDSVQKNHRVSHFSGLPWIVASVSLLVPEDLVSSYQHGLIVGGSFLAGQLTFTLIQHISMRDELQSLNITDLSFPPIRDYLKDGIAYNISFSSSQIYGRTTPLLIDSILGAKTSSLYIYTRNITNMYSQVAIFAKRIEFNKLSNIKNHQLFTLMREQKISSILTTAFFIITILFLATSKVIDINSSLIIDITSILTLQMLVYLLFNIASLYSQPLTAKGMIMENAKIQAGQYILCLILAYPTLTHGGLNLMLLMEACVMGAGIILYSGRLRLALEQE